MEKEKEAQNIRMRISRDIHDEVGATLSGVAMFSEIARQKINQKQESEAQFYLDHIISHSKEMVDKMSDIVWTINPQNDSFERVIAKLKAYAINLCAGKGIRTHFEIDDVIANYYPSMQIKKDIYLLIKEAINNAVKYSEANNIFLCLRRQQDFITVEIKDDGKGFVTNARYEGNGLHNMQARADNLDAQLSINSQKGIGTCINFRFHFHPNGGLTGT
jgi:signal transduction histidine kinase